MKVSSRMTIGKKLILSFAVVFVFMLALGLSSLGTIQHLGDALDSAVNTTGRRSDGISGIRSGFQEVAAQSRYAHMAFVVEHLEASRTGGESEESCSSCHATEMAAESKELVLEGVTMVREQVASLRDLYASAEDLQSLSLVEAGLDKWAPAYEEYLATAQGGDFVAAHEILTTRLNAAGLEIDQATRALMGRQGEALQAASTQSKKDVQVSRLVAISLVGLNIVILAAVIVVVRRSTGSLRNLVGELEEGAEQVASAATQVSSSSQALAQGASEQAASLEETSASSEEINATAQRNVQTSKEASQLTSKVSAGVEQANTRLDQMVAAMQEINTSSEKISKIIQVIDDIAFQTNILALNAAVEAARAGEAGMGFAVVADEVRNLSQRCAQAAQDTSALIEESIQKSHEGKATLDQVTEAIRSITEDNDAVKKLAGAVEEGSQTQAQGTEQILSAITQMQRVTQESAANAEESASVGQELDSQSSNLKRIVEDLTGLVGQSKRSRGDEEMVRS